MSGADEIKKLGTILSIWAHPDDETFAAAGVLATAVQNGQKVICVTATKGEAGVQDEKKWPAEKLGEIREKELAEALKILGITNHQWLGYKDGFCETVPEDEAVAKITELIKLHQPNTLITFGPEGMTGHPDHCTVSRWVTLAAKESKKPIRILHVSHTPKQYEQYLKEMDNKFDIFYNIDQPKLVSREQCALCFDLPDDIVRKKCAALKAMPSQTEGMFTMFDEAFLKKAFCEEVFVEG